MSSKMLIDASHPEETRVVVLKGHRVEEFDFESADKRQLRGNIYLAKVTRVEPSLQAAFVDYGGNRHGFLAFAEIHPDYYQIPHSDRQALLEEEARANRDEEDESRGNSQRRSRRHRREGSERAFERRGPAEGSISEPVDPQGDQDQGQSWNQGPTSFDGETDETLEAARDFPSDEGAPAQNQPAADQPDDGTAEMESHASEAIRSEEAAATAAPAESAEIGEAGTTDTVPPAVADEAEPRGMDSIAVTATFEGGESAIEPADRNLVRSKDAAAALIEGGSDSPLEAPETEGRDRGVDADENGHDESEEEFVEQIGGDAFEDAVRRAPRPRRHYKIQEVIKRRQILLVQVVKEERGNKGAALTTYLSLAGRYSVLMPNTARGGGISRKITDAEDRKRLKSIAQDLEVPEGMGIILRTAGASRSKVEVNRDFEYLLRMWESVRELTLKSTAPALVYEEGSLIKRSIRDLYTRDVEDVIVSGEEGFNEARDFMRMLMPSAAKNVQLYRDPQPIFAKAGAEAQLDAMFSNHVTLKSGGYLVINQTEALVAIDVNSGRSTREHNIEDTALRTNLEAADEVARQLRLRDLAGLIVVDFIDMEEGRNNRAVERRIKEALKNDRARIQIGRISHFGLLEMSRQRIRTGVLEGSTVICPHCAGAGTIRSTASIALHILRLVEDALIKDASHNLIVRTRTEVALYILNQKRAKLNDLESRFGVSLTIAVDATLTGMIYHAIERGEPATPVLPIAPRADLVRVDSVAPVYDDVAGDDDVEDDGGDEGDSESEAVSNERESADGGADGGRRRKRRRRRRGRDRESFGEVAVEAIQPPDDALATMARIEGDFPSATAVSASEETDVTDPTARSEADVETEAAGGAEALGELPASLPDEAEVLEQPRRRRSRRNAQKAETDAVKPEAAPTERIDGETAAAIVEDGAAGDEAPATPKRRRPSRARVAASTSTAEATSGPAASDLFTAAPGAADSTEPQEVRDEVSGAETLPGAEPSLQPSGQAPQMPAEEAGQSQAAVGSSSPEPASDPARPKRSGWWQRAKATFGS